MPHVFSIEMLDEQPTDDMYDDQNFDPFLAAPEAFQYLRAPDLGGPEGPVRVAVRIEDAGKIDLGPSMIDKMLGRAPRPADPWMVQAEVEGAKIATAMRDLGATRAYVRYDGGNDEGFAWFGHCEFKDGSTRDADQVAKDLEAAGLKIEMQTYGGQSPVRNALDDFVASVWAVKLLGEGYGTGEYVMYGAMFVDLQTGETTDDPNAQPVVRNIQLKEQ